MDKCVKAAYDNDSNLLESEDPQPVPTNVKVSWNFIVPHKVETIGGSKTLATCSFACYALLQVLSFLELSIISTLRDRQLNEQLKVDHTKDGIEIA